MLQQEIGEANAKKQKVVFPTNSVCKQAKFYLTHLFLNVVSGTLCTNFIQGQAQVQDSLTKPYVERHSVHTLELCTYEWVEPLY